MPNCQTRTQYCNYHHITVDQENIITMKKKALHCVFAAIFLLHLLLAVTAAASPTIGTGLFRDGNNNAVAAAARSSRRLLLQQQQPRAEAPAAMATNTFRVNGVHQANGKPKVEFDASMKHNPGTNFNPRHN
uniref:Uncharacterized protein n=1 Tax=Oryza meridionalis TaxID=40149 RepID=A0A0E0F8W5_9ORYZ